VDNFQVAFVEGLRFATQDSKDELVYLRQLPELVLGLLVDVVVGVGELPDRQLLLLHATVSQEEAGGVIVDDSVLAGHEDEGGLVVDPGVDGDVLAGFDHAIDDATRGVVGVALAVVHQLVQEVVLVVREQVARAGAVDGHLLQKCGQKEDDESAHHTDVVRRRKAPEGAAGDQARHLEVRVVDEEVDSVEAAHAVALDEAGEARVDLPEHGHDLLVVILDLVVSVALARGQALPLHVHQVDLKAVEGVVDRVLEKVVTILAVAVHHDDGGVGLQATPLLVNPAHEGVEAEGVFLLGALGLEEPARDLHVLRHPETDWLVRTGVQILNDAELIIVVLEVVELVLVGVLGLVAEHVGLGLVLPA